MIVNYLKEVVDQMPLQTRHCSALHELVHLKAIQKPSKAGQYACVIYVKTLSAPPLPNTHRTQKRSGHVGSLADLYRLQG